MTDSARQRDLERSLVGAALSETVSGEAGGWEALVTAESKWGPQETPKERLLLLATKRQVEVIFTDVDVAAPEQGFQSSVSVFGNSYLGTVQRQKKLAQYSAAAHALFSLQTSGMPEVAKPVKGEKKVAKALSPKGSLVPAGGVTVGNAADRGWESLVTPESKWGPQETPKERLLLLATKRKQEAKFIEVDLIDKEVGFKSRVEVFGVSYLGAAHKQKKLAEYSAAAHALYALQTSGMPEGLPEAAPSKTSKKKHKAKKAPRAAPLASGAIAVSGGEGGWEALVTAESKWDPQETPKERLLLLATKQQTEVKFVEVEGVTEGFQCQVMVFGKTYTGTVHNQKKLAQYSAAAHALYSLQTSGMSQAAEVAAPKKGGKAKRAAAPAADRKPATTGNAADRGWEALVTAQSKWGPQETPKERLQLLAARRQAEAVFIEVAVSAPNSGFQSAVEVFDHSYLGTVQGRKRLAENSAAAHALYALQTSGMPETEDGKPAAPNGKAKKEKKPKAPPAPPADVRVAEASDRGWEALVTPESKWGPQETPKERLLLLSVKQQTSVIFEEVEVKDPEGGFQSRVIAFNASYLGAVHKQKKLAQYSAAAHALYALQTVGDNK